MFSSCYKNNRQRQEELEKIKEHLKRTRTDEEQFKELEQQMSILYICCYMFQLTNFIAILNATLSNHFQNQIVLISYWIVWVLITLLIIYSKVKKKPTLIKFCAHLLVIRNILPLYDIEQRVTIDDFNTLIIFILTQS